MRYVSRKKKIHLQNNQQNELILYFEVIFTKYYGNPFQIIQHQDISWMNADSLLIGPNYKIVPALVN